MNDLQLYDYYLSMADGYKSRIGPCSQIYPNFVVITGRSYAPPHPHRRYTLDEFIDKLEKSEEFRNLLNKK